ncbi:hypothetical protein HYT25_04515 [Candidatus Pacearchaeota archaeon]|nr:hypothetical protein [Candidatus Pacearchaeota archaeon]
MHLKRQEVPKRWPIERKGTTYVVRPRFNLKNGVPVLVVLRNMLNLAKNRKEVKRAIHLKQILVNGKIVRDEKNSVSLFDTISIIPSNEHYRIELSKGKKFDLRRIKESESMGKIAKVIGKKILRGKKVQINLSDGNNIISEMKCNTNDSILLNMKSKKPEKCIPFKENAKAVVFEGKHMGESGKVEKISHEHKMAEINVEGKKVNVLIKQIIVVE